MSEIVDRVALALFPVGWPRTDLKAEDREEGSCGRGQILRYSLCEETCVGGI